MDEKNDFLTKKEQLFLTLYNFSKDSSLYLSHLTLEVSMLRAACYILQMGLEGDDEVADLIKHLDSLSFDANMALKDSERMVEAIRERIDSKIKRSTEKIKNENSRPQ